MGEMLRPGGLKALPARPRRFLQFVQFVDGFRRRQVRDVQRQRRRGSAFALPQQPLGRLYYPRRVGQVGVL